MPTIQISLKDLGPALVRDLRGREEQAVKAIRRAVQEHGPRLAAEAVDSTVPKPVDRGTYRRSFRAENLPTGGAFYNYAPHAGVIEDGRRPGSRIPPVDAIATWLFRKGILKGGKRRIISEDAWEEAKQVAWIVARAIAKRGLPAHRVMARVNSRLQPLVIEAVNRALSGQGGP